MDSPENFEEKPKRRPPATTPEGRENQMIALAFDQAELLLREGRAPAQVLVHYLKLGTENTKLERERLRSQIALDYKKAENIETAERLEVVYEEAKAAMFRYQGHDVPDDIEFHDDR